MSWSVEESPSDRKRAAIQRPRKFSNSVQIAPITPLVRASRRQALTRPVSTAFDPRDDMPSMKIVNRATGATITGESGDNIGRGGRKLIYFKDESAHYERPEKIEAALADTTNVQIDISSVNGPGNVFHRRREGGIEWMPGAPLATDRVNVFVMDWRDHPAKTAAWYARRRAKAEADGLLHVFAQEVDRDYTAAVGGIIIPGEWVASAIDAHRVLGFDDDGAWRGGAGPRRRGRRFARAGDRQGLGRA